MKEISGELKKRKKHWKGLGYWEMAALTIQKQKFILSSL
jgi:hypothetical protein